MKLLDHEIDFRGNLLFSLRRYRVWWVILMVTMVFDYLTTLYFVQKFGAHLEANHVVRWLIETLGLLTGALVGKLLQLLAVVVFVGLNRRIGNLMLVIVILLNCFAVVVNTMR